MTLGLMKARGAENFTPSDAVFESKVSVGICVSDSARNISSLIDAIEEERFPEGNSLEQIVIVASGCEASAIAFLRDLAAADGRIVLIEEPRRHGKAAAINKILDQCTGDFLVLVNGDALPERGALGKLLLSISSDDRVGMVAACPSFECRAGPASDVLELMWTAHNDCCRQLNHSGISNQCSDELMVARRDVIHRLPQGLINDGAYLAGGAYNRGYRIKFCSEAVVRIDVPRTFIDLIRQRRRIVFGHLQIWRLLGRPPRTLETLLFASPYTSLKVMVKALARLPRLILALPFAALVEAISVPTAIMDSLISSERHAVWKRYEV